MSKWKRIVFPVVAGVVLLAAMGAWGLPQVRAALLSPAPPNLTLAAQPQLQDQKPYIGIFLRDNNAQVKERLQLPSDQGLVIARVAPDSPGAAAGLQEKDIITAIDGKAVNTAQDITSAVLAKNVGDTVSLTIQRADHAGQEIQVTLGEAPEKPQAPKLAPNGGLGGLRIPNPLGSILGSNPAENLRGATITLTDKDGKTRTMEIVSGAVQSSSSTSISVMANGATTATTFQVDQDTRTLRGKAEDLKQGDRVVVVAEDGKARHIANLTGNAPKGKVAPRGFPNIPFHRFFPGRGGEQPSQPSPSAFSF